MTSVRTMTLFQRYFLTFTIINDVFHICCHCFWIHIFSKDSYMFSDLLWYVGLSYSNVLGTTLTLSSKEETNVFSSVVGCSYCSFLSFQTSRNLWTDCRWRQRWRRGPAVYSRLFRWFMSFIFLEVLLVCRSLFKCHYSHVLTTTRVSKLACPTATA